ncbi:MAG TPA: OsmC family protein [Desulfuromonadales bacterium]
MEITFPGGVAVEACFADFSVRTDQPVAYGGQNSAPAPFDLFLASLGTCAGLFVLLFCQERELPTEGLRLTLATERDTERHRLSKVRIAIHLPPAFPEKYRRAVIRAANQCSVKRAILDPPEFEVVTI